MHCQAVGAGYLCYIAGEFEVASHGTAGSHIQAIGRSEVDRLEVPIPLFGAESIGDIEAPGDPLSVHLIGCAELPWG